MLSRLAKTCLVLTAFAPILLTAAFVQWRREALYPWGWVCLVATCLMVGACQLILAVAARKLEVFPVKIDAVKTVDTEVVAYVLSYLLPLANLQAEPRDPFVISFVAIFFLAIVASSQSYHFNPLLNLLGYHFYEVSDRSGSTAVSYVLVTKRNIRVATGHGQVVMIGEYILLDVGAANGQ